MTAWSAKVSTSAISCRERPPVATDAITPIGSPSRSIGTPRGPGSRRRACEAVLRRRASLTSGNCTTALEHRTADDCPLSSGRELPSDPRAHPARKVADARCTRSPSTARRRRLVPPTAQTHRVLGRATRAPAARRSASADHPQDLGGGGLLLQRLGQVGIALLQLLEQPHVLDGDDRLVGERLDQRDLLVRECVRPPGAPRRWRRSRSTFS